MAMRVQSIRDHRLAVAAAVALVVVVAGVVVLGIHYWHEPEYWLVGVPGFFTAIGTVGLAGATFRLIQREGQDREMTMRALTHSQVMATEAARHRRDDRARLIRISLWQRVRAAPGPDLGETLEDGTTFDMPLNANAKLCLWQTLRIESADGQPMTVRTNRLTVGGKRTYGLESVELPILQGVRSGPSLATFMAERTIAEWVEIAEHRESGDGSDVAVAAVSVDDGFDDGVIDSYEIHFAGCPLRRSAERQGQWILDTGYDGVAPRVVVDIRPMRRQYFISKIGDRWLDGSPRL